MISATKTRKKERQSEERVMPKSTMACEHCGADAFYERTAQHDIEDKGEGKHVKAVPLVKPGDQHIYKCPKCSHLTRVPAS
jgi:hypothetical protein